MPVVVVVGGAGYVGSHCCKALAAAGFEPVVYDNLSTGHREFVRWGPLIEGDIRDRDTLSKVLASHKPVAVMHFAALALVGESVRDPAPYFDVNVVGTLRLLEAMVANRIECLVFSSTCAVYGEPEVVPLAEDLVCRPVNPYGASKLACEMMMDAFAKSHCVRSVRLRYFNAAGADSAGEVGERHQPETHLIPLVIDTALGRRARLEVFGSDYPTADGTAVRDYVHVADLASAHLAALRYLLNGGQTEAVNLGTGRGSSILEVVEAVEGRTEMPVERVSGPRREGDPARLVANPAKANALLNWQATRGLGEIIADAVEWHRRQNR